ncbi:N-acetyltransferase ESCO2 [Centruroides vittatus]|uniref:N-acetyltransferase ESCO2 n=1 Tax=Centruroides vittatus TaxID=120091 RepID=UPI00350ECD96
MTSRVLRERVNGKILKKSTSHFVQVGGKENVSNLKQDGFGTTKFYGPNNDIELSNIKKERLRRSIKLLQDSKVQKKTENNKKNVKQKNTKNINKKNNNNNKHKSKETEEQVLVPKKRCKFEFESSSVEISSEVTTSPSLSKNLSSNTCNEPVDTGKRFFLSKRSSSSLEGKMIMAVNKGRFHLEFKRGTVKKNAIKKTDAKSKKSQKPKKVPLTVNIKSVSRNRRKIESNNKQNLLSNSNDLVATKETSDIPDKEVKDINQQFLADEILNDHTIASENVIIPISIAKRNNFLVKTSTPIKSTVSRKLQLDEFSNLPKIREDPSVISNITAVVNENSKLGLDQDIANVENKPGETIPNASCEETVEKKGRNSNQVVNKWKKILPETLVNENSSADNLKEKQKSSPKTTSKFYSKVKNTSQLIIDAGQKELGAKHCPSCNMLYTSGDEDDERTHKKYHNSYLAKLNFPGWKKERVLGEFSDGRIIMVLPSDPKYMMKKLKTIEQIIDRDLGVTSEMQTKMNMTYILFISTENKVGGCAIVEKISQAHRVIPSSVPSQIGSPKKILHSESESVQALCGICRLWTAPMYRRQKVATRILDCLRCNFIYGYLLNVDDFAFLDPTIDGRQFVEKYTETPNYLVYFKT